MARTPGSQSLMPKDVNARHRAVTALQLRCAGMTEAEIALRVGLSQSRVSRIIRDELHRQASAATDDLRALEVRRADELQKALWGRAIQGNIGAANVVLKASDRRSRLLGLDEGGDGAPAQRMVVTVWLQAIVVDTQDAMRAAVEAAHTLGLEAASERLPGAQIDGAITHLVWLHNTQGPNELDPPAYQRMVSAIAQGDVGV